jgi:hypothetical protein
MEKLFAKGGAGFWTFGFCYNVLGQKNPRLEGYSVSTLLAALPVWIKSFFFENVFGKFQSCVNKLVRT